MYDPKPFDKVEMLLGATPDGKQVLIYGFVFDPEMFATPRLAGPRKIGEPAKQRACATVFFRSMALATAAPRYMQTARPDPHDLSGQTWLSSAPEQAIFDVKMLLESDYDDDLKQPGAWRKHQPTQITH